ncbi:MAG: hypothetical protein F6J93_08645 [Oscillatoria sp. SIO1A7]|nr:hypothetical protein [Oscillatoria sp. SIO1A7]
MLVKIASLLIADLFLLSGSLEPALFDRKNPIYYEQVAIAKPENNGTIDWQQSLEKRSDYYVEIAAVNTENKALSKVFVEKSEISELQKLSKCDKETGICTVKLGSELQ